MRFDDVEGDMQVRYDEERGVYRDCKWCKGKGCLYCAGEAKKEYQRQFPDGPKPIATFPNTAAGRRKCAKFLQQAGLGTVAMVVAEREAVGTGRL